MVYNNAAGSLNMNMSGYHYKNPAIMLDKAYGDMILAASQQGEDGLWGGKMVIANQVRTIQDAPGGYLPSSFSSWGVPGNLDLKPEITAPGGNIWSTLNNGTYGNMSGTSMSAPSVTGMAAVVAQYVKEQGLDRQEGLTVRALSQALLLSTSVPLVEEGNVEYSPRKQGSGLANVYAAVTSPAYLLTEGKDVTDGKAKVNLGDDPQRTGVYEFDFTVNNLSKAAADYAFRASINTMAVETVDGEDYMSDSAYALTPEVTFTTSAAQRYVYDLNGDGVADVKDAEVLLAAANHTSPAPLSEEDAVKYDFDGDGEITTKDVKVYMRSLQGKSDVVDVLSKSYVVEPEKSIQVHATVTLSEADRAYLAENYVNGCYVEGFVYAANPDGKAPELSLPMLAYYGNWTEPSMFDKYITLEDSGDETAYPYVGPQYTNALVMNNSYYLTANPYAAGGTYLADRTAINAKTTITAAYATLIRNAGGNLYAEISNAETGEVYKTVQKGAQYGAFYNANAGTWANTVINTGLSWNVTDAEGQPLPEGTRVKVSVCAIPEYNWNRETGEVVGTLAGGASWDTYLTVDNTAPEILDATYSRNLVTGAAKLNITARDDRYVAAILVSNARQTEYLARQGADQREPGAATEIEVDISEVTASDVVVMAVDYAGNVTAYQVSLGVGEEDGDVTEFLYANDTYDNSWLTFRPDGAANAKKVATGDIYAAEYIDGYVFTIDKDRRFCVAPLEDLENQTYIETLQVLSNVLDLAYNYADGKLYALCTKNYLYTVDPLMGSVEQVGIVPLTAGNNLQTLACSTDGTFYGVTNHASNSRLYSFTLSEEGFQVQAAPNTTGLSTIYIQSMTYDHNTGKLYHANYGFNEEGNSYVGRLLTYDLETGKPTIIGDFGTHELAGMFIPRKATTIFGPTQDVQEISLSRSEVSMLRGGTVTLEVSAKPWTVVDRSCTWATSDEKVATVQDGVITATGAGTCTIAAASVLNPQAVATCTVTVTALEKELTGLVWDADSQVWFSSFRTDTIPAYTKLTASPCGQPLMSMTAGANGVRYAATQEERADQALISTLYAVSHGYELTKIGTSEIGYTDMTWCPNLAGGSVLATYGNYVTVVNTATGNYDGAWDFASSIGNARLVGIAWAGSQKDEAENLMDVCLLLDSQGNVWTVGFMNQGENLLRTTPQKLTNLGFATGENWYFSSIATDGAYLYASLWSGERTDLVALDLNSGAVANLGNFGEDVWPVVGLEAQAGGAATAELLTRAMEASGMTAPVQAETETLPALLTENG